MERFDRKREPQQKKNEREKKNVCDFSIVVPVRFIFDFAVALAIAIRMSLHGPEAAGTRTSPVPKNYAKQIVQQSFELCLCKTIMNLLFIFAMFGCRECEKIKRWKKLKHFSSITRKTTNKTKNMKNDFFKKKKEKPNIWSSVRVNVFKMPYAATQKWIEWKIAIFFFRFASKPFQIWNSLDRSAMSCVAVVNALEIWENLWTRNANLLQFFERVSFPLNSVPVDCLLETKLNKNKSIFQRPIGKNHSLWRHT